MEFPLKLCSLVLTLLIICIGYPLLLLFLIPLWIYRSLVVKLFKSLDPKVGSILQGMDAIMSAHSPYTNCRSVLIPHFFLASSIDLNTFIKTFNTKIVQFKTPEGKLLYTKLKQRIISKFGYHFWYTVDNFQLEDHIRYLDDTCLEREVDSKELAELTNQLSQRNFNPTRSPWEIIIIPKLKHDKDPTIKSVVILRFHHCFLDGFSILKLFERLGDKAWTTISPRNTPKVEKSSSISTILPTLNVLFRGPYEILRAFYFSGEDNEWLQKITKQPSGIVSMQLTNQIPMETLKKIVVKSKGEFTIAIILHTIILQVAGRAMAKQNAIQVEKNHLVKIHTGSPWPLPNHPCESSSGLTNHYSIIKFPVTVDLNDVRETARNVSRAYKCLAFSVLPRAFKALTDILGSFPIPFIEKSDGGLTGTVLLSNFQGPFKRVDICGVECKEWVTIAKATACALSSLTLSYAGGFRCVLSADKCILTQNDMDTLAVSCEKIVKELHQLL
ncbi:unnamed protein product [Orchesella dallaii]|uniref:Diacylglycerol O-acyltransferase n=1 Tax=Orchesella dallaii TaxID=48710 RepID=A0ABP1QWN0_9HEXA